MRIFTHLQQGNWKQTQKTDTMISYKTRKNNTKTTTKEATKKLRLLKDRQQSSEDPNPCNNESNRKATRSDIVQVSVCMSVLCYVLSCVNVLLC